MVIEYSHEKAKEVMCIVQCPPLTVQHSEFNKHVDTGLDTTNRTKNELELKFHKKYSFFFKFFFLL